MINIALYIDKESSRRNTKAVTLNTARHAGGEFSGIPLIRCSFANRVPTNSSCKMASLIRTSINYSYKKYCYV